MANNLASCLAVRQFLPTFDECSSPQTFLWYGEQRFYIRNFSFIYHRLGTKAASSSRFQNKRHLLTMDAISLTFLKPLMSLKSLHPHIYIPSRQP